MTDGEIYTAAHLIAASYPGGVRIGAHRGERILMGKQVELWEPATPFTWYLVTRKGERSADMRCDQNKP
jgi:hypothetical protein